ncbi:hypothetical protein Hanom_Chr13g01206201 [Helianthus anomalus]
MAKVAIVSEEQSNRIPDTLDLMSFYEKDILVLNHHEIIYNDKYEECAKSWYECSCKQHQKLFVCLS